MKIKFSSEIFLQSLKKLISPLSGLAICLILILCFASDSSSALKSFFAGSFTSTYYFGDMITAAAFLMLSGTGAAIAIQSGNMNLGGEGQIYIGGFTGCIILNSMKGPAVVVFITALVVSVLSASIMSLISGILRETKGADTLLTSFLLSAAVIPLIDGLITASKSTSNTNMLSLPYIDQSLRMKQIMPPSPLTVSIFAALSVCILSWFFIFRTSSGRKLQITGKAPLFSKYAGYNSKTTTYGALAVSGALHGITGFFAVTGTYYTCLKDFYTGMGWNALGTALIASSNPLAIIPVSVFLAWMYTSADRVALTQSFGFDIEGIIQGVVLFSIAIPVVKNEFIRLSGKYKNSKTCSEKSDKEKSDKEKSLDKKSTGESN